MRNKQIEGLRGISIILIVIFHVICRFQQLYLQKDILWMNWWGDFGAMSFLMISTLFLTMYRDNFKITSFFKKKFLRLWPAYFGSITITFVVLHIWELPGRTCSFKDYLYNVILVNGYIGISYVDQAHWYLTTLISFICIIGVLKSIKIHCFPETYLCWIIIAVFMKLCHVDIVYKLIGGSYIGMMGMGFCLKCYLENEFDNKNFMLIRLIILLIFSSVYMFFTRGTSYIIYLVLIALLLILAYKNKIKYFEKQLLQYIAKISYPMYLIHQNIAFCIEYQLLKRNGYYSFWYAIIALITIICVSICMYYANEKIVTTII